MKMIASYDPTKIQDYIAAFDPEALIRQSLRRLSYSKITSYTKRCRRRYFFQRVLRIKIPDESYFYLGERVHAHCQRFWEVDYQDAESFANQFVIHFLQRQKDPLKSGRNPGFFRSKQEFWASLNRGKSHVRNFYDMRIQEKREHNPRLIEMPIKGEYKGHKFEARLDEISLKDGKRRIIDIKTIRHPPKDREAANFSGSEQYPLYVILTKQWLLTSDPERTLEERRRKVAEEYKTPKVRDKHLEEVARMMDSLKVIRQHTGPSTFELIFPENSLQADIDITAEAEAALSDTLDAFLKGINSRDFPRKPLTGRFNCHNDCLYFDLCRTFDDTQDTRKELSRLVEQGIIIVSSRKRAPKPGEPLTYIQAQHEPLFLGQDSIVAE